MINNSNYPVEFYDGGVGGSRYLRIRSVGASANTWAGIALDCAGMKANTKYTCSVWFRTRVKPDSEVYMRVSGKSSASSAFSIYSTQWFTPTGSTDEWTLYKWSFSTPASVYAVKVELVVLKNGTIHLCRPMIEEGDEYHGWSLSPSDKTEAGKLEADLASTGIDIENGKITATTDKFEVRNNSGEVTASVNEKGVLEVDSGVFGGFIRKKKTIITPNNIEQFISSTLQNGYIHFDFSSAGSYVEFQGSFSNKFNGKIPVIVLPFHNPSGPLGLLSINKDDALKYAGQTFIVSNMSQNTIMVRGGGEISKCGSTIENATNKTYEIERNQKTILTCEIKTQYGNISGSKPNTFTVVWNGINYSG